MRKLKNKSKYVIIPKKFYITFNLELIINVMIINSQAFNAKAKGARCIYIKLDVFRSRRLIDIIAKTNPILIIDEPQSVEGKQTK